MITKDRSHIRKNTYGVIPAVYNSRQYNPPTLANNSWVVAWGRGEAGSKYYARREENFGHDDHIYCLDCNLDFRVKNFYLETYQVMQFIACQLYLNKATWK